LHYPWSSHTHYALAQRNPLITRHALFDQLAGDRDAFVALFHTEIKAEVLDRIRTTANRGWALGSDAFLDRIERVLGRTARPPKRGRPFKSKKEIDRQISGMLI
jgi:putative transposase